MFLPKEVDRLISSFQKQIDYVYLNNRWQEDPVTEDHLKLLCLKVLILQKYRDRIVSASGHEITVINEDNHEHVHMF